MKNQKIKSAIKEPLINHGTFGVHLIKNPAGTYSFYGDCPTGAPSFSNYESGIHWLAGFIRKLENKELQRELAINSKPELFALIIDKATQL